MKEDKKFEIEVLTRLTKIETLLRGRLVEIKDSKDKSHILGIGYCDNLDLINHYINQLDYKDIIVMFQENEYGDLFIETNKKLNMEVIV